MPVDGESGNLPPVELKVSFQNSLKPHVYFLVIVVLVALFVCLVFVVVVVVVVLCSSCFLVCFLGVEVGGGGNAGCFVYLDICWWCVLILISMRTVSAIRRQDPILGIASADKGRALDVLGAARALCLKICYYLLFSVVPVDGSPGETRISIDSSFCWLYSITQRVVSWVPACVL